MASIEHAYAKLRKHFGQQPLFQSVSAHIIDSIFQDHSQQEEYCLRNPVHREVQATLPKSEHEGNTKKIVLHNIGINHIEGGWPKDINAQNEDHIIRYRRRVCHEDNYIHAVKAVVPAMQHYIRQNNAVELYETYFQDIQPMNPVESYQIRVANSLGGETDRPVSCLVWTNETPSKLAVSYTNRSLCPSDKVFAFDVCYIWDIENQIKPVHELYSSHPCWQLACSPTDPNVVLGGLKDGTVCIFDTRAKTEAVNYSSEYSSHNGPVTSLLYIHSRSNTEFFSGSLDGHCMWWDTRNLSKQLDKLEISIRESNKNEGVSVLQYNRGFPTKFLCGTESGLVVHVNRLGRTPSEVLPSYWETQNSPVRAIQSSPSIHRMFATCGDWSVRIWSEEVHTDPIIITAPYRYEVSDFAWAPIRCSSYMTVCFGGYFYYWDLLRKREVPVVKQKISHNPLTKITPHKDGYHIAIGDSNGSVFMIQLSSENMIWSGAKDKQLMQQLYERERRREHILESRVKEIRLKHRKDDEEVAAEVEVDEDDITRLAEEEYFKTVKQALNSM